MTDMLRWKFAPGLPLGVQVLVPCDEGEWVSHYDHLKALVEERRLVLSKTADLMQVRSVVIEEAREALTDALNRLPIKWTSDELFPAVLIIHRVFDTLAGDKP